MRFGKIRIEDGNLIFARHMMLNNLPCKDIIWAYMRREGIEGGKQQTVYHQFTCGDHQKEKKISVRYD